MLRKLYLLPLVSLLACDGNVGMTTTRDLGPPGDGVLRPDVPECAGGTDKDGDHFGLGCPAGFDCDDDDINTYPGAPEVCDYKDNNCDGRADEGVLNACGTCELGCDQIGEDPFVVDPAQDDNVKTVDGVGLDDNGDLVLDSSQVNFNYMWIANTADLSRGTVSKINTDDMTEVARYFSVTCHSTTAAGCTDLHGKAINIGASHQPSRTAVDFNFDVWVANRAFSSQPSASKIANDPSDCIDRDANGQIETSADRNGDGQIELDCDGDGSPDGRNTTCSGAYAGLDPEFYGEDDECVLFTVNYGNAYPQGITGGDGKQYSDLGRSICLSPNVDSTGPSHAWVGTNRRRGGNVFYRINGASGALSPPYAIPGNPYGCAVDQYRLLWAVSGGAGGLSYLDTTDPTKTGGPLNPGNVANTQYYGISLDDKQHLWLGGWESKRAYRYKPNRQSFDTLDEGTWTSIEPPTDITVDHTRGVAADTRGKVWVAISSGHIWRIEQSLPDGVHNAAANSHWPSPGGDTIGVGVDFKGNIWGISHGASIAGRLDVDAAGNVVSTAPPMTDATRQVPVGKNPYTYSDFTGFGLKNFTRPEGRYVYTLSPCDDKATWRAVSWSATTPGTTSVLVRVRSSEEGTIWGPWIGPFSASPSELDGLTPNPAKSIEVEFNLKTDERDASPILHDFNISYSCFNPLG